MLKEYNFHRGVFPWWQTHHVFTNTALFYKSVMPFALPLPEPLFSSGQWPLQNNNKPQTGRAERPKSLIRDETLLIPTRRSERGIGLKTEPMVLESNTRLAQGHSGRAHVWALAWSDCWLKVFIIHDGLERQERLLWCPSMITIIH